MKVGILTFHRAENFGAIMQVYALQTYLKGLGLNVEIIDYRCFMIESHYEIFSPLILFSRKNIFKTFVEYVQRFGNIKDRITRKKKFHLFLNKFLCLSKSIYKWNKPLDYDCIMVGSDQVWNTHLIKGDEDVFFLNKPFLNKTLRVAYGASSEKNGLDKEHLYKLGQLVDQFYKVSVRESFLKDELSKYTLKEIGVCLDPTFLLNGNDYLKIAVKPCVDRYVLIYHMTKISDEMISFIENIAIKKNLKIIEVYGSFEVHNDERHIVSWGPLDILGYIAYADLVFTTSFHGLAFSVIFNKNFWVVNKGDNLRQKNILSSLGLSTRLLNDIHEYNDSDIDYGLVRSHLDSMIGFSKNFLSFLKKSE